MGKLILVEDQKQGGYTVWFDKAPNIIAEGNTIGEAIRNLENALYDITQFLGYTFKF